MEKIEAMKIVATTANLDLTICYLDEMTSSLEIICKKLENNSEEAIKIKSAIVKTSEANNLLRSTKRQLIDLYS